ncbi:MAG: response regulator transcription factor [Saprospiraceae bacterium]|jgi:two-component system OmpR family response regulator
MGTRILLVEDDQNFGDVLRSYLELNEFEVILARDGVEGHEKFMSEACDLCILDVMMPRKDGFSLARLIREENAELPIIFLTAKALKEDVLEGFRVGADDYITKPFHSEELLMRIQAVLKRSKPPSEKEETADEFELGHFLFNYPLRTLTFRGATPPESQTLSPKEAELLRLFCLHLNDVLPRSEALVKIWKKDDYFTARSMDVFITRLRKYLKRDSRLEIVNIHGNGFRLIVREGASG